MGDALRELFSEAKITTSLDPVLRELSFIGASNFWWSMRGSLDVDGMFNLSTFLKNMKDSRDETHAELHSKHANEPQHKLDIYDNSIFNARWTLLVLSEAFGLGLMTSASDGKGKNMEFTPYNGGGSDKSRFSWTLGTATLFASKDLKDQHFPIRAPAPDL